MLRLRKARSTTAMFLLGSALLAPTPAVFATEREVIYKESRPMKNLFEGRKEPGKEGTSTEAPKVATYFYDPTGKTDPFKPFIAEQQEAPEEKKQRKPKTYLETLDLSQLELIAIVVGPMGNWAMVRDSRGVGHVIQKGTPIGTNEGMVYTVSEKEVIVREEYKGFRGAVEYKDIVKKLPSIE